MRRSRGDQSSAFSLFPFLAVLLCTMGAMVVLLVAMAHVSRTKAEREASAALAAREASEGAEVKLAKERLEAARAKRDQLAESRAQADQMLKNEQQRLTGIEDHLRRMERQIESLRAEASELFAVEEAKFDDQEVAERELDRLHSLSEQLIDDNERLEEEAANRQRRYAIVPLRDAQTGTHRPAVYFECREEGILLQPEGVRLTEADFAPPVQLSSPLAAAVRAVKQYYADHPEARATAESGAPYPLLIVRPGGVPAYFHARKVLESIDADYGYQPVAEEWPLDYDNPNPLLAERVAKAIALAREDRLRLAVAAPQLFRQPSGGWGAGPQKLPQNSLTGGGQSDNPFAGVAFVPPAGVGRSTAGGEQSTGSGGTGSFEGVTPGAGGPGGGLDLAETSPKIGPAGGATSPQGETGSMAASQGGSASGSEEGSGASATASESQPPQSVQQAASSDGQGSQPREPSDQQRNGIAMLRTIRLSVDDQHVALLSSTSRRQERAIKVSDAPRVWMPELLGALKRHADTWGIAGEGMYWKSSVVLEVAPDGQRRAEQLARYLESAGVEVRTPHTASNRGGADATHSR